MAAGGGGMEGEAPTAAARSHPGGGEGRARPHPRPSRGWPRGCSSRGGAALLALSPCGAVPPPRPHKHQWGHWGPESPQRHPWGRGARGASPGGEKGDEEGMEPPGGACGTRCPLRPIGGHGGGGHTPPPVGVPPGVCGRGAVGCRGSPSTAPRTGWRRSPWGTSAATPRPQVPPPPARGHGAERGGGEGGMGVKGVFGVV